MERNQKGKEKKFHLRFQGQKKKAEIQSVWEGNMQSGD
jgi:hypothetical protein